MGGPIVTNTGTGDIGSILTRLGLDPYQQREFQIQNPNPPPDPNEVDYYGYPANVADTGRNLFPRPPFQFGGQPYKVQ